MSNKKSLSVAAYLEDEINKQARADTLKILKGVVYGTPVDKGRAKGNWQTSVSAPITTETELLDPSGSTAISKAAAVVASAKAVKYPTFWISNNLPYIEELNKGSSKQAPAMFVETVIKRVTNER